MLYWEAMKNIFIFILLFTFESHAMTCEDFLKKRGSMTDLQINGLILKCDLKLINISEDTTELLGFFSYSYGDDKITKEVQRLRKVHIFVNFPKRLIKN